jgi:hypothetical protein
MANRGGKTEFEILDLAGDRGVRGGGQERAQGLPV